jgi:polyphosphate glucokinase
VFDRGGAVDVCALVASVRCNYDAHMMTMSVSVDEQILAIDVGATNMKFCHVDPDGKLLETVRRRRTNYPCTPARLVDVLAARIERSACSQVGVGFPGELSDGFVTNPANLARPGGITTEVDPQLDRAWRGFALEDKLRMATGRDVRVVNDAALAAFGCCIGSGTELVLTLGTGMGLAYEIDGQLQEVRCVGFELFLDARTYDQAIGERSRAEDEVRWRSWLALAVVGLALEFGATTVHLAGGNAKRLALNTFADLASAVVIHGNDASLHGVTKLFYN